ncbi:hypothetical protein [Caldimonas tepidiphila]|uniref:hypothetical protein n=1 Tax=Caldimonas tepidiphila TaxID=2315841 RepID=UPI000E5C1F44|nr:hypothetical protein [Caldimonas tepidiphila]
MNRPQDTNPQDRDGGPAGTSSSRPSSSPSDTRSNAASGLTQQGLENQRPQGERRDASSEMQPGSSRDGRLAQQGAAGVHDSEQGKLGPQAHQQPESARSPGSAEAQVLGGKDRLGDALREGEPPSDPQGGV